MKKTFDAMNLIRNGRFIHLFENASEEKKEYLIRRVGELSEELSKYRSRSGNLYLYFCNITTSIAVLEYDTSHGIERVASIQEMTHYMQEFMASEKEKYQKMFQKKFMWKILRFVLPRMMCKMKGEGFHCYTVKNKDKNTIVFYTDRCMFNTVLREKGMCDMASAFCEIDQYMYGDIPGVKFVRLGTLCSGAKNCDFKFVRKN